MRWLVGILVVCGAATAEAKSSNPAFLGVGMDDVLTGTGNMCTIRTVTKGSGADAAGLRPNDMFVSVEGTPIASCANLVSTIQAHESCESVTIEYKRGVSAMSVKAVLCSRADVLRQRLVGQKLHVPEPIDVEAGKVTDALDSKGRTTIVGWYDDHNCAGCEKVFAALDRWARKKSSKKSPIVLVATTKKRIERTDEQNIDELKHVQRSLDLPLLLAEPDTFSDLAISDTDRIHFMVLDCHGVVQYAAPLAPDADDETAVLDELFAAAEQAARRR